MWARFCHRHAECRKSYYVYAYRQGPGGHVCVVWDRAIVKALDFPALYGGESI